MNSCDGNCRIIMSKAGDEALGMVPGHDSHFGDIFYRVNFVYCMHMFLLPFKVSRASQHG
jgi:hypothetical protein